MPPGYQPNAVVRGSKVTEAPRVAIASRTQSGAGQPSIVTLGLVQQRPAQFRLLVAQDDARPGRRGPQRGGQPRGATADDEHFAMGVFAEVPIGIRIDRRPPQPRRSPDRPARRDASRTTSAP